MFLAELDHGDWVAVFLEASVVLLAVAAGVVQSVACCDAACLGLGWSEYRAGLWFGWWLPANWPADVEVAFGPLSFVVRNAELAGVLRPRALLDCACRHSFASSLHVVAFA